MSAVVTFAQAQERAERWINTDLPGYQRRDVRVREFDDGFVAWAEDRADGPTGDGARTRLVIARDSGDATLWPGLPVDEVVRRYTEEYGAATAPPAPAPPPQRVDLEATSFLLTPPEWLQEAADKMGIPDRRTPAPPTRDTADGRSAATSGAWDAADTSSSGQGPAQAPPATVFAPPLSGSDEDDTPPPGTDGEAATEFLADRRTPPKTATAPSVDEPAEPGDSTGGPSGPSGSVHHAATMLADPSQGGSGTPPPPPDAPGTPAAPPSAPPPPGAPPAPGTPSRPGNVARGSGPSVPPPPGAPGTPGARPSPPGPGTPAGPAGGYVPTQMVSADDIAGQGDASRSPWEPKGTDTAGQSGPTDGSGDSTGGPSAPGGSVHHAATMLAGPAPGGPPAPQPPGPPGGAPVGPPPGPQGPAPAAPPPYGHHGPGPGAPAGAPMPPSGVPTVGPGYMAVLRYRAPDGSEQQLIRRSAPGTPHPEWQILHELRAMNVPPQQVLELHTELESCDLPGGYCARMIRETWPQVRVSHTAAYGTDHASRQEGMRHLVEHQGELHQVADAPPRPAPHRVPLPPQHQIQPAPPIPPDGIGHELMQAYGAQGVFRFDQQAVSRQGVPDIVGQVLVWAGVPIDAGPFFWGQAQPGRPVPTLAELAQERGVQPGSDAASYLVMGNDFGRQLCVQYGTAHIVAVPLEAGPDGRCGAPQFVSTGLPEFVRCLALLGRMWRLRYGLTPDQAGRWTVDFQMQLAMLDPAALSSPENWWAVLLEQLWDGLF